jgi:hypothetical protein
MAKKEIRPIRVEGNIAYVPLTQGSDAMIDAADLHLVAGRNWYLDRSGGQMYAKSDSPNRIRMHCLLMILPPGAMVDHIDGDGLNNRRSNLREATRGQNACNAKTRADNKSGFKGVSLHRTSGKWHAYINRNGRRHSLGYFETSEAAARAYALASPQMHGVFARP